MNDKCFCILYLQNLPPLGADMEEADGDAFGGEDGPLGTLFSAAFTPATMSTAQLASHSNNTMGLGGGASFNASAIDAAPAAEEKIDKPNRGAFQRRKSFTTPSSKWTYNKEISDLISGRVKFFFDDCRSTRSKYTVLLRAVGTLQASVGKLGGGEGAGPLLLCRAGKNDGCTGHNEK